MEICYVALGANLGSPVLTVQRAFNAIEANPEIREAICSPLYRTKPVSSIAQPDFVNAVCRFETSLSLRDLFSWLQQIEKQLGKIPKAREAPRVIDLDLLFYGTTTYQSLDLTVPHPRWHERTFVLRPLADLTDQFDVQNKIKQLPKEDVCLLPL